MDSPTPEPIEAVVERVTTHQRPIGRYQQVGVDDMDRLLAELSAARKALEKIEGLADELQAATFDFLYEVEIVGETGCETEDYYMSLGFLKRAQEAVIDALSPQPPAVPSTTSEQEEEG